MADTTSQLLEEIRKEAVRIEEDATYSSTGHFEASKPWAHLNLWIGIPLTLFSAFGGVAALKEQSELASVVAFAVSAGTGLLTFLSPRDRHQLHADAGNAYAALRNDSRIFKNTECVAGADLDALKRRLHEFNERRNQLNASSPVIPPRAFLRARSGIVEGQKTHQVDLPPSHPIS